MAYIGKSIESGTFSVLDTSGNTYNGSNTTFNLGTQVGSVAQLLVSHDGVIQKPGTDYTLASGGSQITFTTAPASGASIFIVEISGAVGGPLDSDLNGAELILDADADTSITADTDDQIDIKIGGADDFAFKANKFEVQTGSNVDMNGTELILDADADSSITADTDDQIDVKIGGTDQFSIKDGVIEPTTDNDVDIGASSKEFKDGYFDGTLHCDVLDLAGTEYTSISGGLVPISQSSGTSGADNVIVNGWISDTYEDYLMTYQINVATNNADLDMTLYDSNGNISSGNEYDSAHIGVDTGGSTQTRCNNNQNSFRLSHGMNNDSARISITGQMRWLHPRKSGKRTTILHDSRMLNSSAVVRSQTGVLEFKNTNALTGFYMNATSGQINYWQIRTYGIINS